MTEKNYYFDTIPTACLTPDKWETAARLAVSTDFEHVQIERCDAALRTHIAAAFSAIKTAVTLTDNGVDFGYGAFESRDLRRNLDGCAAAYILTVTLGIDVDRFLRRLSVTSVSDFFITDALASAYAEAACGFAENALKGKRLCKPRFSAGYGDFPLAVQPQILDATDALKRLNVTLSENLLMTPTKTITAIVGIIT